MFQFLASTFLMGVGLSTGLLGGSPLPIASSTLDLDFASNRYNNAMGPEQLSNPEFAADISSWTPYAANGGNVSGVVWATGGLSITGTGTGITGAYQTLLTVPGKTYELLVIPRAGSQALNINVWEGANPSGVGIVSGIQVFAAAVKVSFVATTGQSTLSFNRGGATTAVLESVSVREVNPTNLGNELVTNGNFATNLTGFEPVVGGDGTVVWEAPGQARVTSGASAGGNSALLRGNWPVTVGKQYRLSMDIPTTNGGNVRVGNTLGGSQYVSTSKNIGTHVFDFIATGATVYWLIGAYSGGGTFAVDNVSLREINPSIASMLTVARSTTGMAEKADGTWVEFAPNVPRITDKGLLVEEARTNVVRNNTFAGGVSGSPGTLPANMSLSAPTGLTRTLTFETINGVECMRVRYQGTAGSTTAFGVVVDTLNSAAADLQTWTATAFFQWVRTTGLVPTDNMLVEIWNYDGASAFLGTGTAGMPKPAVPMPALQRLITTRTIAGPTTAVVRHNMRHSVNSVAGTVYDVEFVVGLPTMEQAPFASSPIKTSGAAVTRPADFVTMVNGPWFNAATGTLYAEALGWDNTTPTQGLVSIDDTTVTERIQMRRSSAAGLSTVVVDDNVVVASPAVGGSFPLNTVARTALAYALNDVNAAAAGTASTTDTAATVPTVTRLQLGGGQGTGLLNGYVRRVAYYPRRLSDAELVTLTT